MACTVLCSSTGSLPTWSAVLHTYTWPLYRFASNLQTSNSLVAALLEACVGMGKQQMPLNQICTLTMALLDAALLL